MNSIYKLALGGAIGFVASVCPQAQAEEPLDPWLSIEGKLGTERHLGRGNLWFPVFDDGDSVFYLDIRGVLTDESSEEGNFGVGFRHMINEEWYLGAYGAFDIKNSQHDNTFYQVTLGAEAVSRNWEFRVNGYIPEDKDEELDVLNIYEDTAYLDFSGTSVGVIADADVLYETALWGVDAEVGYTFYLEELTGDAGLSGFDVQVVGGLFYFDDDNAEEIAGPKGRVSLNWDSPEGLPGWIFSVGLEGRHDDVRDSEGYLTASVQIPIGGIFGQNDNAAHGTMRNRMRRAYHRDVDVITNNFVAIEERSGVFYHPISDEMISSATFFHDGGTGDGTFYDPTTFDDAITKAGTNGLIIGIDGGEIEDDGFNLMNGQIVLDSASSELWFEGLIEGIEIDFEIEAGEFVPQGEVASSAPEFDSTGGDYVMMLADYNIIDGQTFDDWGGNMGSDDAFIYGDGVMSGWIENNTFEEFHSDSNGIMLDNVIGDWEINYNVFDGFGDEANAIEIDQTANTGSQVDYDIYGNEFYFDDNLGTAVDFWLTNNARADIDFVNNHIDGDDYSDTTGLEVSADGAYKVDLYAYSNNETFLQLTNGVIVELDGVYDVDVNISSNTFTDLDDTPIGVYLTDVDYIDLDIDSNTITGVWDGDGILPNGGIDVDIDGFYDLNGSVDSNTISNVNGDGINVLVENDADVSGISTSELQVNSNTIDDSLGDAIYVEVDLNTGGGSPNGNFYVDIRSNNIDTFNDDADTFDHEIERGIVFMADDIDYLHAEIYYNYIDNVNEDAIEIRVDDTDDTYMWVSYNYINNFGLDSDWADAISIDIEDDNGLAGDFVQLYVEYNDVDKTVGGLDSGDGSGPSDGIDIEFENIQDIDLYVRYNEVFDIDRDGIQVEVENSATVDAWVGYNAITGLWDGDSQLPDTGIRGEFDEVDDLDLAVYYNDVNNVSGDGINLLVEHDETSNVTDLDIYLNEVYDANDDGIYVEVDHNTGGGDPMGTATVDIYQNTIATQNGDGDDFDHEVNDGIEFFGDDISSLTLNINDNDIDDVTDDAIDITVEESTTVVVSLDPNLIDDVGDGGTTDRGVEADFDDITTLTFNVLDIAISGTTGDGIFVEVDNVETFNSTIGQASPASPTTIDSTVADAIEFRLNGVDNGGITIQNVDITDVDGVSTDDGIGLDLVDVGSSSTFTVTITDVTINGTGNGGGDGGMEIHVDGGSDVVFNTSDNVVTTDGEYGVVYDIEGASSVQVYSTDDTINGSDVGFAFDVFEDDTVAFAQISGVAITGSDDIGLLIEGSDDSLTTILVDSASTIDGDASTEDGIYVEGYDFDTDINLTVLNSTIIDMNDDGIELEDDGGSGADITLTVIGTTFEDIDDNAVEAESSLNITDPDNVSNTFINIGGSNFLED